LGSLASFGLFGAGAAANQNDLVYNWPTTSIVLASTLALVASLVSWIAVVPVPAVWSGGSGWTVWRKTRYSAAVAVFGALGLLLVSWGPCSPGTRKRP
jgi:hypothetical protein